MRHRKSRLQFNRFTSWHKATLKSLIRSLLLYQSIRTTKVKAQAAKRLIDKLIFSAKKNTLAAKREAFRLLSDHRLVNLLFNDIAPRFSKRDSGFTRVINLGARRGDNAQLAVLELTEIKKREVRHPKKEKEAKPEESKLELPKEKETPPEEKKLKTPDASLKREKPPVIKKELPRKFLGGLRNIFKKERDSL